MVGDASAYAALGLEPGADPAAVEQAYKKLIKQHHPDREGGDSQRAAELNRAYRELRSAIAYRDPLDFHDHFDAAPEIGRWWILLALAIAAIGGGLLMLNGPLGESVESLWPVAARQGLPASAKGAVTVGGAMDQPLSLEAIDLAVRSAVLIARTRDEFALARESGICHHRLRTDPSIAQLDRCAAFDDAVVELQDRDPLHDRGPFSELAVTGRLWSGASALSDDYLAVDGRLDRIRLRVELALATSMPAGNPPANAASKATPTRLQREAQRRRGRAAFRRSAPSPTKATI